jgi:hypothetical protein
VSQPGANNIEPLVQYENSTSCLYYRDYLPPESRQSLRSEFGSTVWRVLEQPQKMRDSCGGVNTGELSLI